MTRRFAHTIAVAFLALAGCTASRPLASMDFAPVLGGEHRSAENRSRDSYRHPRETLEFFGLRSNMKVIEVWPGAGWYTEILAPLLREHGQLYAAHLDPAGSEYAKSAVDEFRAKLAARPQLYDQVVVTTLAAPPSKNEIAPPGSADLVLTFRNLHNWMMFGWQREAFQAMYEALKPGGVLGVVEHRGDPAKPQDPKAASGYVNEAEAVALIESVGFRLVDRSEVNANPKDTKDYERGVWVLPPTYALGTEDRARYAAIGESDRFTLKFVKP
jgi:predicted methyltransferase